jgi:hypothetical protein
MVQVLQLQTQFWDGVWDADVLLTWHNADFGFEDSHIKDKQDVTHDSLLEDLIASNATTCNRSMTSLTFHSLGGHLEVFC